MIFFLLFFDFNCRYHCLLKGDEDEIEEQEEKFERAALEFQSQFREMLNKYQFLLMQESMVRIFFVFFVIFTCICFFFFNFISASRTNI